MKLTFKLAIIAILIASAISSCKVYNAVKENSSFELKKTQQDATSFEAHYTIWDFDEIIKTFIPETPKLEQFRENFEKYCLLRVEKCPKNMKDTLSVSLKCHDLPIGLSQKIKPTE